MQDDRHGVPVRSQKLFLTSIPAAFMGKFSISITLALENLQKPLRALENTLTCEYLKFTNGISECVRGSSKIIHVGKLFCLHLFLLQ